MTLGMVIRAFRPWHRSTTQPLPLFMKRQVLALDRLERRRAVIARAIAAIWPAVIAARHDVIGEDLRQRRLVLRLDQRVDGARRQLREGCVGRREHRERALPDSVSTSPAALTAATSVVWSFELTAFWTMFRVGYIAAPPTIGLCAAAGMASVVAEPSARAIERVNLRMCFLLGQPVLHEEIGALADPDARMR